jgi:hypothetical protein
MVAAVGVSPAQPRRSRLDNHGRTTAGTDPGAAQRSKGIELSAAMEITLFPMALGLSAKSTDPGRCPQLSTSANPGFDFH